MSSSMAVCFYDAAAGPTAANTSSELHKLQLSDLSRYPESLLAQAASRRSAKEQQEGIAVQQYADYLPFVMNIYRTGQLQLPDIWELETNRNQWFAELALALDYFQLPTIYELVKQQPRYRLPGLQQYFAHKLAADVAKQVLALLPKGLHTMRTLTDRGRGYCLPTEVA
eukprot:jgi/Chrzof1/4559/Cz14g18090.t1